MQDVALWVAHGAVRKQFLISIHTQTFWVCWYTDVREKAFGLKLSSSFLIQEVQRTRRDKKHMMETSAEHMYELQSERCTFFWTHIVLHRRSFALLRILVSPCGYANVRLSDDPRSKLSNQPTSDTQRLLKYVIASLPCATSKVFVK